MLGRKKEAGKLIFNFSDPDKLGVYLTENDGLWKMEWGNNNTIIILFMESVSCFGM